jgi:hypothetical protein
MPAFRLRRCALFPNKVDHTGWRPFICRLRRDWAEERIQNDRPILIGCRMLLVLKQAHVGQSERPSMFGVVCQIEILDEYSTDVLKQPRIEQCWYCDRCQACDGKGAVPAT